VQGSVFFGRGLGFCLAAAEEEAAVTDFPVCKEWTASGSPGGGAAEVGKVVVEGREKRVGGRAEYCVKLWRGPLVVA